MDSKKVVKNLFFFIDFGNLSQLYSPSNFILIICQYCEYYKPRILKRHFGKPIQLRIPNIRPQIPKNKDQSNINALPSF